MPNALIDIALLNLAEYERRVESLSATKELAYQVLGVQKGYELSDELLEFALKVITDELREELSYINESRASFEAQLTWHEDARQGKHKPLQEELEDIHKALKGPEANASSKAKKKGTEVDTGPKEKTPVTDYSISMKDRAKYAYYVPIRNRLMALGFVVSPPGTALGAVFPQEDWVEEAQERLFWNQAKEHTDELMLKYSLLGDDASSLTRLLMPEGKGNVALREALVSAVGCICVSWTRHKALGKTVYVPILGLSGVVGQPPDAAYFQKYCRHLGLPEWESDPEVLFKHPDYVPDPLLKKKKDALELLKDEISEALKANGNNHKDEDVKVKAVARNKLQDEIKKLELAEVVAKKKLIDDAGVAPELLVNYETMIRRTNRVALGHRLRTLLELRTPSRQALFSYVSFRQQSNESMSIEKSQEHPGVDLWISGWHSLNCAEPAALMTASSFFCEGSDVLVCFPYEGLNPAGASRNRPKETCAWCAAVELGFRSLCSDSNQVENRVKDGKWLTQFTRTLLDEEGVLPVTSGFDAFDDKNPVTTKTRARLRGEDESGGLVRNRDLSTRAYSDTVETKIGRLRSMYHLLGLLDPEVVLLGRPLFGNASRTALVKFMSKD